jgi:DNA-binding MarR family transcriptional regulator
MPQGLSSIPEVKRTVLRDYPPSAKLVYLVLSRQDALTQQQLVAETLLSKRTARHALRDLEDAGLVTSRPSFIDARQKLYSTVESSDGPARTVSPSIAE